MSLSERLRPDVEAAPWVIEEVKALEAEINRLLEAMDHIKAELRYREETLIGRTRDLINLQNAHDKLEEDHKECDAEIERLTGLLKGMIDAEDAISNYRFEHIGRYPNVPIPDDVRDEWNRQLSDLAYTKVQAEKAARAALAEKENK